MSRLAFHSFAKNITKNNDIELIQVPLENRLAFAPAAVYYTYIGVATLFSLGITKVTFDARTRTIDALDVNPLNSYYNSKDSNRMSKSRLEKAARNNGYRDAHDMKDQLGLDGKSDVFVDKDGNMYSGGIKGRNRDLDPLGHNENGD